MAALDHINPDEAQAFLRDKFGEPAQQEREWRKICVGVLSYDAKMYCRTHFSLQASLMECAKRGWSYAYISRETDSMVARGRSFIASQFLENPDTKDGTDLVFVDCDLEFSGEEFARLCEHDADVVAGAYPYKDETGRYPLRWSTQGFIPEDRLWTVQGVTPGFFRVRRHVLERMAREMPWLEYDEHVAPKGHKTWAFFNNLQRRNGWFDECYIFCEYWKSLGGTVLLDPDCNMAHLGVKAYKFGSIRSDFEKKQARIDELKEKYPHIDPDRITNDIMTGKGNTCEADYQHSDPRAARSAVADGGADASEHRAPDNDPDDIGGRGRPENNQRAVRITERPEGHALYISQRGQSWGEVRQSVNGGPGGHLPAGG